MGQKGDKGKINYPKQSNLVGRIVVLYSSSYNVQSETVKVLRDDVVEPFVRILQLENEEILLGKDCKIGDCPVV